MTTHLSTRITWHDRGWDGHVCDCASANSSCLVHKHIRESRDDDREMQHHGQPLAGLEGWLPPCSRDINAFSPDSFMITHHDPLDWRNLPAANEKVPPYSVCPAPYRWMREEYLREIVEQYRIDIPPAEDPARANGWVNEPKRQRLLLNRFWSELEDGRSIVFFYCNQGNPIEDGPPRLLVGASRLVEIGKQLMFGKSPQYGADHPVWSRRVSHGYPEEGVRLPLQEYLRGGHPIDSLVCPPPDGGGVAFSYVAEHVSDDLAVGALEQLVQAVESVKRDSLVDGDWDAALGWLDRALEETWKGRGLLPGIGSVLRALGMERGIAFQRAEFVDPGASRADLWGKAVRLLDGFIQPADEPQFYESLKHARNKWKALPEARKELLGALARFELSVDQVDRLSEPRRREKSGISASEEEIIENPYLLFEQDHGTVDSARVALDTVDRGAVLDPGRWAGEPTMPPDHIARVRACAVAVLEEAADKTGDTFLPIYELLDGIERKFPERRQCKTDLDVVMGSGEFLDEALRFERHHDPPLVALPRLRDAENEVRDLVERRWRKENDVDGDAPSWAARVSKHFAEEGATALAPELEQRAQQEKLDALRTLYRRRLSVLTGRAGTGKTAVIRVLLDGIAAAEGKEPILLLAPTGKARVRLASTTNRPAQTIHQFLLRNKWLDPDTLGILPSGGSKQGAPTVIIDEASMVSIDLLGALCRALDLNVVKRLVFVGDPNQLPPIDPGRPFVDLISWLEDEDHPERSASLAVLRERARHEHAESRALQLADGYLRDKPPVGSDELLAEVANKQSSADLDVEFYDGPHELRTRLETIIDDLIEREHGEEAYAAFTRSLGAEGPTGERAEAWQILSPIRERSAGTTELNRQIQQRYKRGLLDPRPGSKKSKTFGDEDIVWTDKVIQIRNRGRKAWPPQTGADYVANGEIGVVLSTDLEGRSMDVAFSTQKDVTYRYWGSDAVDDQLRLAYAVTVHKAQGSDFDTVILVLPVGAPTLSRELLYTALTRFRKRMILLLDRDVSVLRDFRRPERSSVLSRNSNLFEPQLRPTDGRPFPHRLVHQAENGALVRSKAELVVLETLLHMGLSVEYERQLDPVDGGSDFRLPDFTVSYEGDVYYWEHLGMLDLTSYSRKWKRKLGWYRENGYIDRLITSSDGEGVGMLVPALKKRAERRILAGESRRADEPGFD